MAPLSPLSRRVFASSALLAAASMALPSLRAQPRPEMPRVVMAVGGKSAFYYLPLTIAERLGYFRAEGLNVDVIDFSGGSHALQALLNGAADVCSGAFEHIIKLQAGNQQFQAFVLQGRAPQIVFGVSTRNLPDFKAVTELKGCRIGVSSLGSSTHTMANLVLSRGGVKSDEVNFVGVGTAAAALAALRSGQLDAISNTDPVMTMLERRGEVRLLSDTRSLKGAAEVFGGPMPAACLYASAQFIRRHPNTCQALANAMVRSLKWLQTAEPVDIVNTVPDSYLLQDRGLYLAAFDKVRESISLDGTLVDDGPATALKALASVDSGINAEKISLAKTYTNVFAQRAKDGLRI
ncbi:MAG: ABC transporter substrate-binding protein [Polaromonas sp.]